MSRTCARRPPGGRRSAPPFARTTSCSGAATATPGALPLIVREVAAGHRAFVVVPLVEEDPDAGARSVEQGADMVRIGWAEAARWPVSRLPLPRIEIVHGQMKASERDERMERFRSGEAQVVVGTTVLEVGVDVPEATVMLILDADRFGLAQLHQLRGRVGRGEARSYCVLVTDVIRPRSDEPDDEQATVKARLDALAATTMASRWPRWTSSSAARASCSA